MTTTKEIIPPDPVPIAKDVLNPHRDFCASMIDMKVERREIPITKELLDEVKEEMDESK